MNSKDRMLIALDGGVPDRLPVTTHHLMPSFLDKYMEGATSDEFFQHFGLDAIRWLLPTRPNETAGEYYEPNQKVKDGNTTRWIVNDNWRIKSEPLTIRDYEASRYHFVTPKGELTMVMESNEHTSWVVERLVKEKKDIELLGEFMTAPKCDVEVVNKAANEYGRQGIIRGHICCNDVFGQPGVWQDAACLYGTEKLIMATFFDPAWVHEFLGILLRRKLTFVKSLKGADYDLLELGGGDASTTVISPEIFNEFVAPYDSKLISEAQQAGQRIVYHTCGGMMPILEDIAVMGPNAMETFTPVGMGGDVDLAEVRHRIGSKVCMIGGFDQFHFFTGCTEKETKEEVKRCFKAAGKNGGFILCPSDHFFDAELPLIQAFSDAARTCNY